MLILYVILILSVTAIVWAAIAIARHVRRGGKHAHSDETLRELIEREKDAAASDGSE
jgi:hypothetical protein